MAKFFIGRGTMNGNLVRLGEIVKAKRQENGLSLRAAAKQIDISASTLSRLERGIGAAPDTDTIVKLSEWLKASVDELLFGGKQKFIDGRTGMTIEGANALYDSVRGMSLEQVRSFRDWIFNEWVRRERQQIYENR